MGIRAGWLPLLALLTVQCWGQAQNPQDKTSTTSSPLTLALRVVDGRTEVHVGELVSVELTFRSREHQKYFIMVRECSPHAAYHYNVDPPRFVDRLFEVDAAMGMAEMSCGGPSGEVDPAEQPFQRQQLLNARFRMETPGKYKISVTSTRLGPEVTSNVLELEILPRDPAWEKAELERAVRLMDSDPNSRDGGCTILRYLGTDDANLEMAKRYTGKTNCDFTMSTALISAANRQQVLAELEAGVKDPSRLIAASYLRTIAIVSVYQQHPGWFPSPLTEVSPRDVFRQSSGIWGHYDAVRERELHYARVLLESLPNKTEDARAESLEGLMHLDWELGKTPVPADIRNAIREQMPSFFAHMSAFDQEYSLKTSWPKFESPAMIPVLKKIVDKGVYHRISPVALLRLYQLSPEEARPIILREIPKASMGVDVLGVLPDKELPQFDGAMFDNVKAQLGYGSGATVLATGVFQRYASNAVAGELKPLVVPLIGKMECQSEANLLAYFLRVSPKTGKKMLEQEMKHGARPGCQIFQRLNDIWMSREVEDVALHALDNPDAGVVRDALYILQRQGSVRCRPTILSHFEKWHKRWAGREQELESSKSGWQVNLEGAYLDALGSAQGWITSKADCEQMSKFCVTKRCREDVDGLVRYVESSSRLIMISDPVGDETEEHYGMAPRLRFKNIEALEDKMMQYPKGTAFKIDGRDRSGETAERLFGKLKLWADEHGLGLEVYRE